MSTIIANTTTFTVHHLRFTVQVETTIQMDRFKGSALRGSWQSHLRTLYCAQAGDADPLHQAMCPVCFLLSRDTRSGEDRRPYAFVPPITDQTTFQPGERFTFGISLFGQSVQLLPYLVLAVNQMGQQQGLGRAIHPPTQDTTLRNTQYAMRPSHNFDRGEGRQRRWRRGTFRLVGIDERNPLTGQARTLLAEGGAMVHMPSLPVTQAQVEQVSRRLAGQLADSGTRLVIEFLTPTRIVHDQRLIHQPLLAPLLARLLDRLSALRAQYASEAPLPQPEKARLLALADRVQLAADETRWWDVRGHSTRLEREQALGGLVGRATYQAENADVWRVLLPWLLWGQCVQVGKNVVKGCGVIVVSR
jgi:hypothetical protein